jgi:hypothetical protein
MADAASCNQLGVFETEFWKTRNRCKSPVKSLVCSSRRHWFDAGIVCWRCRPQQPARRVIELPRRLPATKKSLFLPMGYGSDPIVAATYAVLRVIFCIHSHHFCLNPNEDPASHPRHE